MKWRRNNEISEIMAIINNIISAVKSMKVINNNGS
jgi:hypothetical protein